MCWSVGCGAGFIFERYTVENLVVGPPCGEMDEMAFACGEHNDLLAMVCQEFGQLYMSRAHSLDSPSSATFKDEVSRSRHQIYVLTSFRLQEQSAWLDDLLGDWGLGLGFENKDVVQDVACTALESACVYASHGPFISGFTQNLIQYKM
ncbi:Galactokinase [Artemisia annua]|uniref:Galactokinase n=1 Tax=Artemisia annua TaxID=35608 RepID=A0A2U1N3Q3_ARTAN|nr:Galactokinase [Artemisia annua]